MRFLLKAAFWLTIVALFLPAGENAKSSAPQVGASEAISAAGAAVADARQFCSRQPDVCVVGSQAASVLGQKAQNGAKMLYEFLSDRLGPDETGSVPAGEPGGERNATFPAHADTGRRGAGVARSGATQGHPGKTPRLAGMLPAEAELAGSARATSAAMAGPRAGPLPYPLAAFLCTGPSYTSSSGMPICWA